MEPNLLILSGGVFIVAALYSSVGHAGASGYIAVMSLLSMAPSVIKPSALALNILVASIATFQFARAGHFSWRLFWPFATLAVPAAFVGGYLTLPTQAFKVVLGLVLLYSALRFIWPSNEERSIRAPALLPALVSGAAIGLLSGLTGTGGGIFLTPLLLFMGWAAPKQAAGVSALFILVNSVAGLLGNFSSTKSIPDFIWYPLISACSGGLLGSYIGSSKVPAKSIKHLLACVLLIAGGKLVLAR